jgi:hypothetical protein
MKQFLLYSAAAWCVLTASTLSAQTLRIYHIDGRRSGARPGDSWGDGVKVRADYGIVKLTPWLAE